MLFVTRLSLIGEPSDYAIDVAYWEVAGTRTGWPNADLSSRHSAITVQSR